MALLIACFKEMREIGRRVAHALGGEYADIIAESFPDSELRMRFSKNPSGKIVVVISSMAEEPNSRIIETILAGGIARDFGAKKVILFASYMPYMRQDRHFLQYDSFSSRHIIELFSDYDKIIAIDPHLHRIHKMRQLSGKAKSVTANQLIADYIKKQFGSNFTIVGPDEESAQWSGKIARLLKKRVIVLKKFRISSEKVRIKEKKLGRNIVIIDDSISTGHTIRKTIDMARSQGAESIIVMGIHGVLVKNADKLITKYARLVTTNTIPNKYEKIDISPLIAGELRKYSNQRK